MRDNFIKKQALSAKNDRLTGFIDPGGKYATEKKIDEMIPFIVDIPMQVNYTYSFNIEKMPELRIFRLFGDVETIIPEPVKQYCTLYGNIKDQEELDRIYTQSDVLLLTSAYEGLPIAVMETMARGKVVVSTAVDGIPDYITHKENGLLITETDEEKIIDEGIELLELLITDPGLKKEIGRRSYAYAVKHFSGEAFCGYYRKILQNDK